MTAHVLENHLLRVTVLPESGGKISSLQSVRTGAEFLLQPLQPVPAFGSQDLATMPFSHGDLGGFDECLPSVALCDAIGSEAPIPDHGDLWRKPWNVESSSQQSITLTAEASSRPLRLSRVATLAGDTLVLDYEIGNISHDPATWLWSAHPLLQVESGDRIYLPSDITTVNVEYTSTHSFPAGAILNWPKVASSSGTTIDLSIVPAEDGATAHKLFARMGASRIAALYRTRLNQGIAFHVDPLKLPYIGLWISAGGWPSSNLIRQYTVAIEPTTSHCDSLSVAEAGGSACRLAGGDRRRWRVAMQLLGAAAPCVFPGSI